MLLFHENLGLKIGEFLKTAEKEVFLISPFIKLPALKKILENFSTDLGLNVVVRWQKRDLISDSSDCEIYPFIKSVGGRLLRHPKLHAKVYATENQFIFGSANVSDRALFQHAPLANLELLSHPLKRTIHLNSFIENLLEESVQIDDANYFLTLKELEKYKNLSTDLIGIKDFDHIISKSFRINLSDLPLESEYLESSSYFKNFFKVDSIENFSSLLISSKIIKWLKANTEKNKEYNFGQISKMIHDSLPKDPRPYRKTIKHCQSNLYKLINQHLPDVFLINFNVQGSDTLKRIQ